MKITICFLLISLSAVFAENSYAKKTTISVEMNNKQIENILETVESQTDFTFLYDASLVNVKKRTSINVNNRNIFDLLNLLFADTDIAYSVVGKKIILNKRAVVEAIAQQTDKKISGTVKDLHGETIIGANVVEKGTTNGTITDLDGKFALNVMQNATIVVSYIGYSEQELVVSGKTSFNVILKEDSELLDEVIVVGYGTQKKINLTGSIQNVTSEDLMKRNTSNASTALQGMVSGLSVIQSSGEPGADGASLKIRGAGSLNSSSYPLILIDGTEGDINNIDLNSIKSISVLKDAASASIYGSRASNGVILITTKRGAVGKLKISYNGYVGLNTPTEIPDPVNALQYMKAVNVARSNADMDPQYSQDILDI